MGTTPKQPQDRKKPRVKKLPSRATAGDWRARSKADAEDVEVPSGNIALVKRVGPEAFLASGRIPDALTPIIEESIRTNKGLKPEQAADIMSDQKMLPQVLDMMNEVVCWAVVEPRVEMPYCVYELGDDKTCGVPQGDEVHTDREIKGHHNYVHPPLQDEFLWADEVDFDDKVFVFNFAVGGTRDLERFREEFAGSMADIQSVQRDEGKAE